MAEVEAYSVMLRRLWANTWDAARFSAERPLHKPAFELSGCGVQLELAAQAVARIREAIGKDLEFMDLLPLEGRSCSLLEQAVDTGKGLPHPAKDPVGFVQALVRAALQTGDGSYCLGLRGAEEADALLEKYCGDLLDSARGLQDPAVASRDLESAAAELALAVQAVLSRDFKAAGDGQAVEFSSRVVQLSRELRQLAGRALEAATPRATEAADADIGTETTDAASVFQEADHNGDVAMSMPEEDAEAPALERTKSQVIKRIKVDEIAQTVKDRREPIQQLRKALSQLDGKASLPTSGDTSEAKLERTSEELKQVQKLQQSFRNFGEDLMEGMLSLDRLSGLAEPDRQVRKDTLKGLQGLLDEIDAAKPRVAKMQKRLAAEMEEAKHSVATEQQQRQQQQQQQQQQQAPPAVREDWSGMAPPQQPPPASARLAAPQVDWARLRLPLKFSSVERPHAYLLSASAAGLDPQSIRLSRGEGGTLCVQGARLPSAQEERALLRQLSEHINRMPARQRTQLQQREADEMLLQLGHGRFGHFRQEFELPRDVDAKAIEPSYEDGVLRVVLPRRAPAHSGYPGSWLQGMPDSYSRGPVDFLW